MEWKKAQSAKGTEKKGVGHICEERGKNGERGREEMQTVGKGGVRRENAEYSILVNQGSSVRSSRGCNPAGLPNQLNIPSESGCQRNPAEEPNSHLPDVLRMVKS